MSATMEALAVRPNLLSEETLAADADFFQRNGYCIVRNAFTPEEMEIAKAAIRDNPQMQDRLAVVRKKTESGKHNAFETIFVWNDVAGDDLFAKLTRNYQIMERLERFFQDRVYVYHNKVALKYPGVPGFSYHQDYYYWYSMGCLYPDMATTFIALDAATRENGCLRVMPGSYKLGRVNHTYDPAVEDSGVDRDRLEVIKTRFEEKYVELAAGDLIVFHANTLHGSDDNNSDKSRISLLGCYNTKHNDPYMATDCGHPFFSEQEILSERVTPADLSRMPDFSYAVTSK